MLQFGLYILDSALHKWSYNKQHLIHNKGSTINSFLYSLYFVLLEVHPDFDRPRADKNIIKYKSILEIKNN